LYFDAGRVAVLNRDGELDPAAANPFLHRSADTPFGLGETLWHPQLQVEVAMIDGADGDRDGRRVRLSRRGREPRHALNHVWSQAQPLDARRWLVSPSLVVPAGARATASYTTPR